MGGFINGVCGFWFLFWGLGLAWVSGVDVDRVWSVGVVVRRR